MSVEQFQKLVAKALWEERFREVLFCNPDQAMRGYDLTKEECAELQRLERERIEKVVAELQRGISKALLGFVPPGSDVGFNPQPEPPGKIDLSSLFGRSASV